MPALHPLNSAGIKPARYRAVAVLNALKSLLGPFDQRRALMFGAVIAIIFAGLIYWMIAARSPEMAILYSDIEPAQAQTITGKLTQMGVPYALSPDGSAVMAPRARLAELRMALAENNIGGALGNEILDQQSMMGRTSAEQQVNFKRALEGELARTIRAINAVRNVRVHIVLASRQLFDQNPQKATASIILGTNGRLPAEKVNAIRYLVASAVPELNPDQISIIDQSGTLLARSGGDASAGVSSEMNERQQQLESRARDQIIRMVEQVVGAGRAQAQVNMELDVTQVHSEAEVFDPDKQVINRSTTVERKDQNSEGQTGGEVTVANALPDAQKKNDSATTKSSSGETSEQVDFSNSRTKTTTIRESGAIKRVTVSVLVDGTYAKNAQGQTSYAPRSQAEMDQLTALVKTAVGFDADRNDQVTVSNLRFADVASDEGAADKKSWMDLSGGDVARLVQTLIIGALALLALIFVVRPMLKQTARGQLDTADGASMPQLTAEGTRLALPAPDSEMDDLLRRAAQGDEDALTQLQRRRDMADGRTNLETEIDIAQIEGKVKAAAMRKVGDVVDRHPAEAAAVIRQWMLS